jgi:hypothetical protein
MFHAKCDIDRGVDADKDVHGIGGDTIWSFNDGCKTDSTIMAGAAV